MSKGSGRAKGCLSCLGLALCFVFIGAGIPMGLIVAGIGVHDRFAADRPIMCGDDVMPDDDRYVCSGGTSSTYEGLLEDRRDQVEQAPYTMVIGFSLAALGALALLIIIWFLKAPGPQDPKSARGPTRDRPGPPP